MEDLTKGQQRWYRIDSYPEINVGACTGAIDPNASGITVLGQTKDEVGRLAAPLNLVAEVAKDSSGEDAAQRGVLLQWLRPLEAAGVDDPAGYAIQVSTDDGLNWAPVTGNTGTTDTIYRHASPLVGDEQRIYQVRSASSDTTILSDWGNESYYPPRTAPPATAELKAPTMLNVVYDDEDPDDIKVRVSWEDGDNAVGHLVMLFTSDFVGDPQVDATPTGSMSEFDVSDGSYIAVVVSYDADPNIELEISDVVPAGN